MPRINLKSTISFEKPIGLDTIVAVASLIIALFSLFTAVKQMNDANVAAAKQDSISRKQQKALEASRQALEKMTRLAEAQTEVSQEQLDIVQKQRTEELTEKARRPLLELHGEIEGTLEKVSQQGDKRLIKEQSVQIALLNEQILKNNEIIINLERTLNVRQVVNDFDHTSNYSPTVKKSDIDFIDKGSPGQNSELIIPSTKTGYRSFVLHLSIHNVGNLEADNVHWALSANEVELSGQMLSGIQNKLLIYNSTKDALVLNNTCQFREGLLRFSVLLELSGNKIDKRVFEIRFKVINRR